MKVSNRKTTFGEYDFRHIPIYSQHWVEGESESALGSIPSRQEIKESRGSLDLMVKTGAQILWECLEREGVTHVFGYPGGVILPAYDALKHSKIHHVLVRDEQGAAHMADGYARASGQVGVAIATSPMEKSLNHLDAGYVDCYLSVKVNTLLLPPLVQPTSAEFPLGVSTITFTDPGADITSVESFTFNC